jgi:hypothetical protein
LEAINSGSLPRFAAGGAVGSINASAGRQGDASIVVNAPITVNGSSGSPEQNADLAKQMGKQMEGLMRGVIADEFRRARRPGNLGNSRSG